MRLEYVISFLISTVYSCTIIEYLDVRARAPAARRRRAPAAGYRGPPSRAARAVLCSADSLVGVLPRSQCARRVLAGSQVSNLEYLQLAGTSACVRRHLYSVLRRTRVVFNRANARLHFGRSRVSQHFYALLGGGGGVYVELGFGGDPEGDHAE